MPHSLALNNTTLLSGDLKSLTALFNDLSGLSFARQTQANWLDKMSAKESYTNYLKIKADELGLANWEGTLSLLSHEGETLRAHLFATHAAVIANNSADQTSSTVKN